VLVLLLLVWLAANIVWTAMLIDSGRRPPWAFEQADRSKGLTVTMVFFAGWIGAAYYFFAIRSNIAAESKRGSSRPLRSDDDNWTPPAR
jgi:hypothetical protein